MSQAGDQRDARPRRPQGELISKVNFKFPLFIVDRHPTLPQVAIGMGCQIKNAILDEGCVIPDGMFIGVDPAEDARRFHVTDKGVVLVTADMLRRLQAPAT